MPNAAIDSLMSALLWKAGPVLVIAGIASLLLRELLPWFERSVTRAFQSRRTARRHSAENLSSLNHQTEHIPDCPMCDAPMVKRSIRHGRRTGKQFWGCANYPMCRTTRTVSK